MHKGSQFVGIYWGGPKCHTKSIYYCLGLSSLQKAPMWNALNHL